MGVEKARRIDREVGEIHSQIKRSNLILRQRMRDIQQDMELWTLGEENGESEDITE